MRNPTSLENVAREAGHSTNIDHFVYDDGGREAAGYRGSSGDCVTRAIAIASGLPYEVVYKKLALGNEGQRKTQYSGKRSRSARNGINTTRQWFKDFMRSLEFRWVACMAIGSGCKVHLRREELPEGRLICSVSHHYVAVIDGVIRDTYNPDRKGTRCVYGYWMKEVQQ